MKIQRLNGKYYLHDRHMKIPISTLGIREDEGRSKVIDCTKYIRDLVGFELGTYQEIMGKTFTPPSTGGLSSSNSAMFHKDFLKFLKENQEPEPIPIRLQAPSGLHSI